MHVRQELQPRTRADTWQGHGACNPASQAVPVNTDMIRVILYHAVIAIHLRLP